MRYPVGVRFTHLEAVEAANESARMTGMRYRVECLGPDLWEFAPVQRPALDGIEHMEIRV